MKKILLATTLIAASTGFAAAEVAVSGSARMGVFDDGSQTAFSSRVRIVFTASGETDNGLSFGASVRNDQSGVGGTENGDSTVYISGAFGKLTMGDTGNAADALVGQVSGIGYGPGALDGAADIGFLDDIVKTGVQYEYSAGAVTFAIGTGQIDTNDYMSAAVKYSTDAYSVALGYEDSSAGDSVISLLGSATFSGATIKAKIADSDSAADLAFAMSVDYAISGATVTAFYADDNALDANYGIGASYDLGGGAAVKGGLGSVSGDTVWDLGVTMSF
jgi:outer membrane protein OmpU